MNKIIDIEGMNCQHCVQSVEKALNAVNGVSKVKVNLSKKNAVVTIESSVDDSLLTKAVEDAGFVSKNITIKKSLFK